MITKGLVFGADMYISTKSKYENTTNRIHFPLMIVV